MGEKDEISLENSQRILARKFAEKYHAQQIFVRKFAALKQ